jgi:hypothetical protein
LRPRISDALKQHVDGLWVRKVLAEQRGHRTSSAGNITLQSGELRGGPARSEHLLDGLDHLSLLFGGQIGKFIPASEEVCDSALESLVSRIVRRPLTQTAEDAGDCGR